MAGKSSQQWLKEHFTDIYVKRAHQEGYRSRAVYKLLELHERYRLFKPGMVVVDLGAAPGGWSQVVSRLVKPNGKVIALDILPIEPIEDVDIIQGDFSEDAIFKTLCESLNGSSIDWVISDMAPNMSGNESVDIPRAMYLVELALAFATDILKPTGGILMKVFQGEGADAFFSQVKKTFKSVIIRKPKASRSRSREVYLLARELKPK